MAVYSRGGNHIATVNGDQTLRIYDSLTGDEITRIPTKHEFDVTCVSFYQDDALLATGSKDATIRFWDVATGLLVFTLEEVNKDTLAYILCMCFDHSGTFLITGCYNCLMKLWDTKTQKCIHTFADAHTAPVLSVTQLVI
jgi:WD40 repeat protein